MKKIYIQPAMAMTVLNIEDNLMGISVIVTEEGSSTSSDDAGYYEDEHYFTGVEELPDNAEDGVYGSKGHSSWSDWD